MPTPAPPVPHIPVFADQLTALLQTGLRRLIGTSAGSALRPVAYPQYQRWSARHVHHHGYREVLIPLSGNGLYGLAGQVYPCRPGVAMLFDINVPHDLGYPRFSPAMDHLWISLPHDRPLAHHVLVRHGRFRFQATRLIRQEAGDVNLLACWPEEDLALPASVRRRRFLSALEMTLCQLLRQDEAPPDLDRLPPQRAALEAVVRHLQQTAGQGESLETLARLAGYSKFHFLRLFRKYTGKSVHEYIDACRRQKMRQLLQQGQTRKSIAYALGFSSPSAFSRWCRMQGQ